MKVIASTLIYLVMAFNFIACGNSEEEKPIETGTKEVSSSPVDYKIEPFVEGLEIPWSIVFTSPERMLVAERPGRIRVVENGVLRQEPLKVFNDVVTGGEEGLMGLTLDPEYETNKLIYVSYAYEGNDGMTVKVVQYKDDGASLSGEKIIIDNLPARKYHAGCRLRFGPDGKLYITTGDAGERHLAQETDNLYGKILRINPDGTVPDDNPYPGSPIWSIGHRNPQGIDWYPGTDVLYSTEHGPSGFDGPGGGDEVNVIVKGGNYGWPIVSHENSKEGMIDPVLVFTPAEAPASGMFYSGDLLPQFKNNFFFGSLRGRGIVRVEVNPDDPSKVTSYEKMSNINYGRIRDITQGPDGAIYFATSNQDGRGNPAPGDDKIYRITAK
ncbi:MAG TPA: PQQ-dependent sugar dehydrogenase [Ignavibacteria bacterium]|nr:PQQ-dependent sugar dehydrogenase [Ignavibacteria bacterium]